jgi:23S rRNA (uracil1939-C5)-methyltransferase
VSIERWVYGGAGLARVDGKVVFAPFTMPGEKARIEVESGVNARLLEVLERSPERVEPPCPVFARCGGCNYQHAPYEFQLARKVEILREQLRRVGKIEYAGEIEAISGPAYGYRNRVQVHIDNRKLGYLAARSHALVALTGDCPVASPKLNEALAAMRKRLKDARFPRFLRSLELFTNETDVQVNVIESAQPLRKDFFEWCGSVAALEYPTALGNFRVGPRSFFQVNRFLVEKLVETAINGISGESAGQEALDLYAGVGLFAIPLAKQFGSVTAVEAGSSAAQDLEFNAGEFNPGAAKISVEHSRVEDYLARLESAPEFVLADPPRAGLGKEVVAHLNRLAPKQIVIVSCDPATLARDLAALTGYRIERVTLVDLFPQTYHIETVIRLARA